MTKPVSTILEQILEDNPQAESEYLVGQPKSILQLQESSFREASSQRSIIPEEDSDTGADGKTVPAPKAKNSKKATLRFQDADDGAQGAQGQRSTNLVVSKESFETDEDKGTARTPRVGPASGQASPKIAPLADNPFVKQKTVVIVDTDGDGARPEARPSPVKRLTSTDLQGDIMDLN